MDEWQTGSALFTQACMTKYKSITYGNSHAQTGKIMTKISVTTNRLSFGNQNGRIDDQLSFQLC